MFTGVSKCVLDDLYRQETQKNSKRIDISSEWHGPILCTLANVFPTLSFDLLHLAWIWNGSDYDVHPYYDQNGKNAMNRFASRSQISLSEAQFSLSWSQKLFKSCLFWLVSIVNTDVHFVLRLTLITSQNHKGWWRIQLRRKRRRTRSATTPWKLSHKLAPSSISTGVGHRTRTDSGVRATFTSLTGWSLSWPLSSSRWSVLQPPLTQWIGTLSGPVISWIISCWPMWLPPWWSATFTICEMWSCVRTTRG